MSGVVTGVNRRYIAPFAGVAAVGDDVHSRHYSVNYLWQFRQAC